MIEAGSKFAHLARSIVSLSESNVWAIAKTEWKLKQIFHDDDGDICLCTHDPIKEICVLRNAQNGNEAWVGNCCVKRFLGLRSDLIFYNLKRVRGDISRALNGATVNFLFKRRVFNKWEYGFLRDTHRKRKLSGKQHDVRVKLNQKALAYLEPKSPPVRQDNNAEWFAMFG